MDYKAEALKYLTNYRILKQSLKMLNKQIDKLIKSQGPSEIKGPCYDEIRAGSPKDNTLEALEKLEILMKSLEETKEVLRDIDEALNVVAGKRRLYKTLLVETYIYGRSLSDLSKELGISSRQLSRNRNKALILFAAAFLGITALE